MNIENLNKVIAIVQRSSDRDAVYMPNIQSRSSWGMIMGHDLPKDEAEFYARGNKAALLGLVALSPEWKAEGGEMDFTGRPCKRPTINGVKRFHSAQSCMEDWLELQTTTVAGIFIGYDERFVDDRLKVDWYTVIYKKKWNEIRTADLLRVLNELKTIGEIPFLKRIRADLIARPSDELAWTKALVLRIDGTIRILERAMGLP